MTINNTSDVELIRGLIQNVTDQNAELTMIKKNLDDVFQIICGMIISFMQLGFACLEAGFVRPKNITNIFFQNVLDLFICCFWYWLIGYGLSYGSGNSFLGLEFWAGINMPDSRWASWFFQFIFAATAATILTGAVAERCNPICYFAYCSLITGIVYPIVVHWVWSPEGWLNQLGYKDFSGAGPVHVLGGVSSFFGALIIGPRIGRFTEPRDESLLHSNSVPLIGIGMLILVSGFLGFNGGSLGHISQPNDTTIVSIVICNTIISGFGGILTTLLIYRTGVLDEIHWPFSNTVNGCLAGMVAICGSPDTYSMAESILIGVVGSVVYFILHHALIFCKVDDPLDASAVHFGAGAWGIIAAGIFANDGLIKNSNFKSGCKQLGVNVLGVVCIFAWTTIWITALFLLLKFVNLHRVTEEEELDGLDVTKHKEEAYAEQNIKGNKGLEQKFVNNGFDNYAIELSERSNTYKL